MFAQTKHIHISTRELITLTQRTPLTLRNGEYLPKDVLRTGITISVEVKCFNDAVDLRYLKSFSGYRKVRGEVLPTTHHPACVMSFIKVSDAATRNDRKLSADQSGPNITVNRPIFEELAGIQLEAHDCYSIMRFMEIYHIMLELTSLVVLLSLPSKVMRFVLQFMLGKLSAAYQAMLNEPVDLAEAVVLWSVRSVAHMTLFTHLLENASNTHKSGHPCQILDPAPTQTMAAPSFQVLLQHALADVEDTDPKKLGNLAHFTMQAMLAEREEKQTPTGMRWLRKLPQVTASTCIGVQQFVSTCRSDAELPCRVMMQLLDTDRSLGLGERLFFPAALWEAIPSASASNVSLSEEVESERASLSENEESEMVEQLQQEVVENQRESEASLAQLHLSLKSAMQDIKNLRSDFDLAHEEMRSAYQDLNHTRLELECAKKEMKKASREETKIPDVPAKTNDTERPMLPDISSVSSLPRDWFVQIEQLGKKIDRRLAHVEKQISTVTLNSLGKSKGLPDVFAAIESRRQANDPDSNDEWTSQHRQEYTKLRKDVSDMKLSLSARIDEVLFRCAALEHMLQDHDKQCLPLWNCRGKDDKSRVHIRIDNNEDGNRYVTAGNYAKTFGRALPSQWLVPEKGNK